jgi:GxxExxY protein
MEVHKVLGPGLLEAVYQEAFAIELQLRNISFQREVDIPVVYKGRNTDKTYRVDFICSDDKTEGKLVELKAIKELGNWERAITLNYLKLNKKYKIALLINFGSASLEHERFVDYQKK